MREMQRKNLIIPLVGDRVIYFQRRKLSRRESETGVLSEYRGAPDRLDRHASSPCAGERSTSTIAVVEARG